MFVSQKKTYPSRAISCLKNVFVSGYRERFAVLEQELVSLSRDVKRLTEQNVP